MYPINTVFEWDAHKAALNYRKHGITFDEAIQALYDPWGLYFIDREHSTEFEEREICIGFVESKLLVVVFTERPDTGVRIISARKALKNEEPHYYEQKT